MACELCLRSQIEQHYQLTNLCEQLNNTFSRLGTCLKEQQATLISVCLCLLARYCSLYARSLCACRGGSLIILVCLVGWRGNQVKLVAYERNDDVWVCLALQFLDPRLGLFKRALRVRA